MRMSARIDAEKERRLRWHCRRGLLELDLTLGRFLDTQLATFTGEELEAFEELLRYDDTDLWALLTRRRECADPRLAAMVERLRVL
jgi:succinate dehydrogenase flavin-adding protein (antitoxin of CptAB toxin-antitoxin module)